VLTNILPTDVAGTLAAVGFAIIATFQAALALGAPLGRAAWGGKHRVLPVSRRRSSAVAVVVWLVGAAIILARARVVALPLPDVVLGVGAWALVIIGVLGAMVNVASSSPWERFGWAPFAAVLALLSLVVASSPS
jgi:hypothetical protein